MFKLLMIEESFEIKEIIKAYFQDNFDRNVFTDFACDCHDGLEKVRVNDYDLLLVDQKLSGENSLDICRRLRENSSCPIVYITDLNDEKDIEQGYALSPDDHLIKPFSPSDIYRLVSEYINGEVINGSVKNLQCGGIRMNPETGLVTLDGRVIDVTPKSLMILKKLLENKSETVSREEILNEVWGDDNNVNGRVVDTQIKNLKKLLGRKGKLIKNVRGLGYRISEIGR